MYLSGINSSVPKFKFMAFQYDGCNYSMIISATLQIGLKTVMFAGLSQSQITLATECKNSPVFVNGGETIKYIPGNGFNIIFDYIYPPKVLDNPPTDVFGNPRYIQTDPIGALVLTGQNQWIAGLSGFSGGLTGELQDPTQAISPPDASPFYPPTGGGYDYGTNSPGNFYPNEFLCLQLSTKNSINSPLLKTKYAYASFVFQIISEAYGEFDYENFQIQYLNRIGAVAYSYFPSKFKIESLSALECLNNQIIKTHICKDDDVNFSNITVPIFASCNNDGTGNSNPLTIQVIQGTEASTSALYEQLYQIQVAQNCAMNDDVATIPDGWALRPEYHRPQAIYQFAEVDSSGNIIGSPKYKITVPHHLSNKPDSPLPNYNKGNWEIIYVLNDNSKITIHSLDEANGQLLLAAILPRIDQRYLTNAYTSKSGLVVTSSPLQQITVTNRLCKYWSQGCKNELPDWVKKW